MLPVRFTREHEWIRVEDGIGVVGITEYAQEQLGDVVFVELPAIGMAIEKGAQAAVVESVKAARLIEPLDLPHHQDELTVERTFRAYAERNLGPSAAACFLGAGAYRHHVPASVDHLIQRGEFLTAYTPYQPEIAQGTLQYLFEFQTQVALITGMEIANASLYDGATACAEAVMMACRVVKRKRVILSGGLHPHYRATSETYCRFLGFDAVAMPPSWADDEDPAARLDRDGACVVVQNPDLFGRVHDYSALARACHARRNRVRSFA